jgi:[methyl-Co(III) methanol-specific corrinoid protein]:coenzyme M methyltransferase
MISSRDRLINVLNGNQEDRPPCICPGGMMNMVTEDLVKASGRSFVDAHHNPVIMAELATSVYDKGCFENYGVPFCMTIEAEAFGAEVAFGNDIVEPHVSKYCMDSVSQWQELPRVDHKQGRSAVVLEAIKLLKAKGSGVPIIGNITGPISTASSIMEPVDFYKELRKKNEDAHGYLNLVTDSLVEFALLQIEAGADIIAVSDPSGTGEILGPKYFEEFAVPYLNRIVDAAAEKGIPTIVHICGQMKNVYKQVNKIQSHALSFDAMVNMTDSRKELTGRCLMGNLSTYAIEFATPEKISELTKQCLKQGVNIVSPACGLGMKSPIANVQSILKTVKEGYDHGKA